MHDLDLIGVGIGPFNLSLAALLDKAGTAIRSQFLDGKPKFDWHPEILFEDSTMQTGYLKDLVTPVDPTSPYSYLNYLVQQGRFYAFLNTQRTVISRREFEQYCTWVSERLGERLQFGETVREVSHDGRGFVIRTDRRTLASAHVCVATGMKPRVPESARGALGPRVILAKSPALAQTSWEGCSVLIVGGGQTGIEVLRNGMRGRWGRADSIRLITRRRGLEPLDESAFTNEFFTPGYVGEFWGLDQASKDRIVASQKLASDGNTPAYLQELYNDLYRHKHVERDPRPIEILACRKLEAIRASGASGPLEIELENTFLGKREGLRADLVILCTGFESVLPPVLEPLYSRIALDEQRRFRFRRNYSIEWDGPASSRIYALNYSRHNHGIADPQTSLMAWRSAHVVNDLLESSGRARLYRVEPAHPGFIRYGDPS